MSNIFYKHLIVVVVPQMIFASLAYLSLLLAASSSPGAAEKLADFSFEPPFQEVDNSGLRLLNRNWKAGGTAVVNTNFARLTPDRQSKKGTLWSKKPLGVDEFSAILKFRISGQAKQFFGDGIGFWVMQQSYWKEGNLHAVDEKFVGVGIIFDTFKNTENLASHRDVTVIVNDGEKTWEMMTEDVRGCQAQVRYHNDRADFSVKDASRAKVVVEGKSLSVYIDATNSGEWTECVKVNDIGLPGNWLRRAYLGLSASTGQLADNHDIISLATFSDSHPAIIEDEERRSASKRLFNNAFNMPVEQRLERIENTIDEILKRFDDSDHHVEHELAEVNDHIKSMLSKLEKREDKSETRLDLIEEAIKKNVDSTLRSSLSHVERTIKNNVDAKLDYLKSELSDKLEDTARATKVDSQSWKIPFIIIVVLLGAFVVGMYAYYKYMLKKHLL